MLVKCEFIIAPSIFFWYVHTNAMVIASGSDNNMSLRHSPRRFTEGNLALCKTIVTSSGVTSIHLGSIIIFV